MTTHSNRSLASFDGETLTLTINQPSALSFSSLVRFFRTFSLLLDLETSYLAIST